MEHECKERVLLVDDEPQVLVALEDLLCDQFVVLKADSAQQALDLMDRERDIAVVITDQRMPTMTGDAFLSHLGTSSDAIRILLTGYADLSAVIRAVNDGGIFAYVTKPWNPEDLRLRVHKAAEHFRLVKELADERQLLRDLMHNIPDAIYFKDRDLRFLRVNQAFTDMVEAPNADALVGKRLSETHTQAVDVATAEIEESNVLDGWPLLDQMRQYRRHGKVRWFSETKAPIRDPSGHVIGLVGMSRDVTERVATQDALRESEERLRTQTRLLNSILDNMAEGVIAIDRAGLFLLVNRKAEAILGPHESSVPADAWAETYGAFLPDRKTLLPAQQNPLLRAANGEVVSEMEIFVRNTVVSGAVLAVSATPLNDIANQLAGGIAVLRDVTHQRQLEQQLAQSQKMEAIGHLAGGVAHDFNNLLAVIVSYGELLLRDLPEADPMRADLGEMLAAAQRATSLTRQLLAFSRHQMVQPKALALNDAVSNVEKMLRRVIGEDVTLQTTLLPSLGVIKADAGQVEQILLNLAVNSRDAMPNGGRLSIQTSNVVLDTDYASSHSGVQAGEFVMLLVSDSGHGMTPETMKRIFEPFFTTKDVGKGTGLGLATVYGIVQQSGGHIWVESELGRGTTFKVYFPRIDGRVEAPSVEQAAIAAQARSATILLVEDDDAVRQVAARILRNAGYSVLDVGHANDARRICREQGPSLDLLVTDVVMPEVSGPKLATELTQFCPHLRVLYMSGYAGANIQQNQLIAGAAYLDKPFTPRSLANKVHEVLSRAVGSA